MAEERITEETTVKLSELASVLGISGRRVNQLAQDGVIVAEKRGQYRLCESVQKYIAYRQSANGDAAAAKREQAKDAADVLLKTSRAQKASLELKELQGKMHRSEDVQAMTSDLIYAVRAALIALPGRLAVDTAAESNPRQIAEIIRREVSNLMGELMHYQYDPKAYAARVQERLSWEASDDED